MFLYLMTFAIILIVLLSAVLLHMFFRLHGVTRKRFDEDIVNSRRLDDVLFR